VHVLRMVSTPRRWNFQQAQDHPARRSGKNLLTMASAARMIDDRECSKNVGLVHSAEREAREAIIQSFGGIRTDGRCQPHDMPARHLELRGHGPQVDTVHP